MDFRLLGPVSVIHNGLPVDLGAPRQRALLALLLIHANETVSAQRLIDELFADPLPKNPATTLQIHVSRLRKALTLPGVDGKDIVLSRRPGYAIQVNAHQLDSWQFERMLAEGRAALADDLPELACERLIAALDLWRGRALSEFTFESFAQPEIFRLEELWLTAMEELFEAKLASGHHREVGTEIEALIRQQPLRERLWGQLMVALYRSGRQADALRAYERLRIVLVEELGIDPSPDVQALNNAILLQKLPMTAAGRSNNAPASAAASGSPPQHNLPVQLTRFIGRAGIIERLRGRASTTRLLTLTGPGGAGKTSLAVRMASEVPRPAHGIWFVDLSSLTDPSLVAAAIASVLRVREERGEPMLSALARMLREAEMLLILDNCEHLVAGCAEVVSTLLNHCPSLRVLATSRCSLGVSGETIWPVPPLSLPERGDDVDAIRASEAVQLFADRAGLVQAGFAITAANAAVVARICERVDGLPLAIELAAARVASVGLDDMASRLGEGFNLLVSNGSGSSRHRSLLRTLDWSHEMLDGGERAVLRRLSVFRGGATLAGAERVCGWNEVQYQDVCAILSRLVDKSVVKADISATGCRYRLLESVRDYAAARLYDAGEITGTRDRHADWCMDLAVRGQEQLTGAGQQVWVERLRADLDNMRAAMEWTISTGDEHGALRLAGSLTLYWKVRGAFTEGRDWLRRAVDLSRDETTPARATAIWGLGLLTTMLGNYEAAIPLLEQSLTAFEEVMDSRGRARALLCLGVCRLYRLNPADALASLSESTRLARAVGDAWALANSLGMTGWAHLHAGDPATARPLLEEAVAVARRAEDTQSIGIGLIGLGDVAMTKGDHQAAADLLAEALTVARSLNDPYNTAAALILLGRLTLDRTDCREARDVLASALTLARQTNSPEIIADALCALGDVERVDGRLALAEERYAEARSLLRSAGSVSAAPLLGLGDVALASGNRETSWQLFEQARSIAELKGNRLVLAEALYGLGESARGSGAGPTAVTFHLQALHVNRENGALPSATRSIEALAVLAATDGHAEHAARLLGAASTLRQANGYPPRPADHARRVTAFEALRALIDEASLQAELDKGAHMTIDEAADHAAEFRGGRAMLWLN